MPGRDEKLSVLCLGAHADDIEIGAGGTVLSWIASGVRLEVHWCVLSASGARRSEAEASAAAFLAGAVRSRTELAQFKDGFFPYQGQDIKSWLERLRDRADPDVILTHRRDDAHQDHREVCQLTWNLFRDHLILVEYEIPNGTAISANQTFTCRLPPQSWSAKSSFCSPTLTPRGSKDWFDADTFRGLARLRGMECRAPERRAEAFVLRKATLG